MYITVPNSGNYSLDARPASASVATTNSVSASSAYMSSPSPATSDGSAGRRRRRGRRLSSDDDGNGSVGEGSVSFEWEVDLTRPETHVLGRPKPVTTAGEAVFRFACTVSGEEPSGGCLYEYQMFEGPVAEVDWERREWLPTVRRVREGREDRRRSRRDHFFFFFLFFRKICL